MFKFCPSCTKETAPGWKCCPYCGFKFEDEHSVESKEKYVDSTLDDAIGNLLDLAKDRQIEDKLRVLIIRGKYDEARRLCDELIDKNPMDKVGYIGLIRIASQNYKVFEEEELEEDIRIAQEIFGKEELLNDAEYANFESARKQYLEEKTLKLKEEEENKRREDEERRVLADDESTKGYFKIEKGILKKYKKGVNCDVIIPCNVTSIGYRAFYNCSSLTSIVIPNSVTSIGSYAFSGCSSLTSVVIPNSVTSIDSYAFSGCSSLTNITIPSGLTSIDNGVFYGCSGLTSIMIPSSVTSIDFQAFRGCSGLTTLTIPSSVTNIDFQAFYYCSGLTSIKIPNSVTSISSSAFEGCSRLKSVTIPYTCKYESTSFPSDCKIIKK